MEEGDGGVFSVACKVVQDKTNSDLLQFPVYKLYSTTAAAAESIDHLRCILGVYSNSVSMEVHKPKTNGRVLVERI